MYELTKVNFSHSINRKSLLHYPIGVFTEPTTTVEFIRNVDQETEFDQKSLNIETFGAFFKQKNVNHIRKPFV